MDDNTPVPGSLPFAAMYSLACSHGLSGRCPDCLQTQVEELTVANEGLNLKVTGLRATLRDRERKLTALAIENQLHKLPNGCCISQWNGSFDINLLEPGLTNSSRRILSSSNHIDQGLFDRAHERLAELRAIGVVK